MMLLNCGVGEARAPGQLEACDQGTESRVWVPAPRQSTFHTDKKQGGVGKRGMFITDTGEPRSQPMAKTLVGAYLEVGGKLMPLGHPNQRGMGVNR